MPESSGGSHLKNPWLLTGVAVPIIVAIISIIPLASLIKGDDDDDSEGTSTPTATASAEPVDTSQLILTNDDLAGDGIPWYAVEGEIVEFCGMDLVGRGSDQIQTLYTASVTASDGSPAQLTFFEYLALMDETQATSELREIASLLANCDYSDVRLRDGSIATGYAESNNARKIGDKSVSMRVDFTVDSVAGTRQLYTYITYFQFEGLVGVLSVTGEYAEPSSLLVDSTLVSAEHKILGH